MRCRPGDLAMVVDDHEEPANNGGLVRVLRRADPGDYHSPVDWHCTALSHLRMPLFASSVVVEPGHVVGYRDVELRPLRGDPGRDETLEWVSVPRYGMHPKAQTEFSR